MASPGNTGNAVRDTATYEAALEEAVKELLAARARTRELNDDMIAVEQKVKELRSLIDALEKKVPADDVTRILSRLDEELNTVRIDKAAGTGHYSELVDLLYSNRLREWKISEVQQALSNIGYRVDNKSVGTTMARLARRGALIQVARGIYRVPEQGIVLVTADELESAVDLTRSCED